VGKQGRGLLVGNYFLGDGYTLVLRQLKETKRGDENNEKAAAPVNRKEVEKRDIGNLRGKKARKRPGQSRVPEVVPSIMDTFCTEERDLERKGFQQHGPRVNKGEATRARMSQQPEGEGGLYPWKKGGEEKCQNHLHVS